MIDLHRFGHNPILDRQISIEGLIAYTDEHLARMIANPLTGTGFSAEIAATGTLLTALGGSITREQMKTGLQKARTAAKANFRATLPNQISRLYGGVIAIFGQNAPEVQQFFPEGREVFSEGDETELSAKLTALRDAIDDWQDDHAGAFNSDNIALAAALVTDWNLRYGEASAGRSATATEAETRRTASAQLRTQLFKNLLKIAGNFAGQRDESGREVSEVKILFYCPQHLLGFPLASQPGGGGGGEPTVPGVPTDLAQHDESGITFVEATLPAGAAGLKLYRGAAGPEQTFAGEFTALPAEVDLGGGPIADLFATAFNAAGQSAQAPVPLPE